MTLSPRARAATTSELAPASYASYETWRWGVGVEFEVGQSGRQEGDVSEDGRAGHRMALELFDLGCRERTWLAQNFVIDPDLADVVQQRAEPEDLQFVGLNNKWKVEPGDFKVRIGNLEKQFTLK